MSKLNHIGLDENKTQELNKKLNTLLSNYSIFYQNVRGYHWNIKGDKFFELHVKFEELYDDLFLKIDEIAERILTLGGIPEHRYSAYSTNSSVKESNEVNNGHKAVENILSTLQELLIAQREILNMSDDLNDEGTNALMSDYIREQEKSVWMYSSFLNK